MALRDGTVVAGGPDVTVCVSTRNRADRIARLIEHLEEQILPRERFEVVIVDDGSTDDTARVLAQVKSRSPLALTVLRSARRQGAAAGRNRAWRAGSAPVCAFTDDDCTPTPGWLANGLAGLGDDPAIGAGPVSPRPDDLHRVGPFSRQLVVDEGIYRWWATANLFVRRADLEAVGGFDEDLDVAGEDTDLGLRILDTGVEARWLPAAQVHHDVELSSPRRLIREQRRWIDVPGIIGRHPDARATLLHRRLFWKSTHPRLIALVGGLLAARRQPAAALLALPWLHARLCTHTLPSERLAERVVTLPGALAVDAAEIAVMARGSVKHRSLML